MNNEFEGVVDKISRKLRNTRFGERHGLMLISGDNFFGAGLAPVDGFSKFFPQGGVKPGDKVKFTWETNAGGYKDINGPIRVVEETGSNTQQDTATSNKPSGSFGGWTERDQKTQESIQRQTARRDAIDVVKFLVESGKINVTKTKTLSSFLGYVDEATDHFLQVNKDVDEGKEEEFMGENDEEWS